MKIAIYNPIDKNYKSVIGGVNMLTPITYTIYLKKDVIQKGVHFCVIPYNHSTYNMLMTKVKEDEEYNVYSVTFTYLFNGLNFYHFSFWNGEKTQYVSKGLLGDAEITNNPISWQETVTTKSETPNWFKGKIMYQIFPDRFNKSGKVHYENGCVIHKDWNETPLYKAVDGEILNNDFFGGNFEGIIAKLDYLKSLNVSIIYLNPIFEARSNHKYDTGDYSKIDECFGGEEKFKELIKECKKKDIRIILDGVFNHVGMDSKYFNKSKLYDEIGAYNSKNSKYINWFTFKNYPDDYLCWWDIKLLPAISENCPSFIEYICGDNGIVEKYMRMGIDGFRLDVVDELPDEFLDRLTKKVKAENSEAVIIGEVWEDASNKISYGKRRKYFTSNQLDGVMNYVWKNAIIKFIKEGKSNWLYSDIIELINNYPQKNIHCNMNILGTHDTKRIITELVGQDDKKMSKDEQSEYLLPEKTYKKGVNLLKLAVILQFTLCGVPSIYYGDEAGVQGYRDPFNRRTFPWGKEDKEVLEFYKTLSKIRENTEYVEGDLKLLPFTDGVIAFIRGDKFLTVVNRSENDYQLNGDYNNLLTNEVVKIVQKNSGGVFVKVK